MADKTGIEWTDATWNPIRGCSRVSEGCRNCYAEKDAHRFGGVGKPFEGLTSIVNGHPLWNGTIKFVEEHLLDPLKWKKPRRIFVNSMSDLFHENVTDEMRDRIFAVMALCPQHTFQVLTKRPERMLAYCSTLGRHHSVDRVSLAAKAISDDRGFMYTMVPGVSSFHLHNVWLGVSVENQKTADERIPLLLQTPAAKRFISAEPLLGPIDLDAIKAPDNTAWHFTALTAGDIYYDGEPGEYHDVSDGPYHNALDWVIAGGESGPGARPMHPDWVRGLRDQCKAAGVPFFFKQWGAWAPGAQQADYRRADQAAFERIDIRGIPVTGCAGMYDASDGLCYRIGKKAAGALLDGVKYREFPA